MSLLHCSYTPTATQSDFVSVALRPIVSIPRKSQRLRKSVLTVFGWLKAILITAFILAVENLANAAESWREAQTAEEKDD